jgi:hypothetical protein
MEVVNILSKNRIRKKKKKRDYSNKASKMQRFIFACLTIVSLLFIYFDLYINEYIQGKFLINYKPEVMLFVTNSVFTATIPFSLISAMVLVAYFESKNYEKFVFKIHWNGLRAVLIVVIVCAMVPLTFLKDRYDISQDGIYKYSAFGQVKKEYSWSDISEANVYIERHRYRGVTYLFNYDIKLNNGKNLRIYRDGFSRDVWSSLKIIDDILKENGVVINRNGSNIDKLSVSERDRVIRFIY